MKEIKEIKAGCRDLTGEIRVDKKWLITKQESGEVHVTPLNDWHPHSKSSLCECQPMKKFDGYEIWTHFAWDGREFYEVEAILNVS